MKRREFLMGVAAGTALSGIRRAQAQTPASNRTKLDRIAMMTLNFTGLLKTPGQPASPDRTLDLFDLPDMYADTYGVHNIELQHYHMASTEASYFRALRDRIDRAKSKATQLVVEFGALNISAPDHNFLPRLQAIDLTAVWIDRAAVLGCPRIMVNQGAPTPENRHDAVDTLKAMADYGRAKGVKVTMETRGNGGGAARGGSVPPPAASSEPAWAFLNDIARSAGGYINIDLGGVGAASQDDLHAALRALLPTTSDSMHVRLSPNWDLATVLKFLESSRYTGIYSIEARGHEATRAIYDTLLANI